MRLTPDQRVTIAPRYLAGEGTPEIAASLGCTQAAVYHHLVKHGVPTRSNAEAQRLRFPIDFHRDEKPCSTCKVIQSLSAFSKNKSTRDGLGASCRGCQKVYYDANTERSGAYYVMNAAAKRDANILRKYGLTATAYEGLLAAQGRACAICGLHESDSPTRLHVDHDHATGAVRGILCAGCNKALGLLGDDIDRLQSMQDYLRKNSHSAGLQAVV